MESIQCLTAEQFKEFPREAVDVVWDAVQKIDQADMQRTGLAVTTLQGFVCAKFLPTKVRAASAPLQFKDQEDCSLEECCDKIKDCIAPVKLSGATISDAKDIPWEILIPLLKLLFDKLFSK